MDIGGIPFRAPVPADSNPGTVRFTPGGVGRNIAHDLTLMGVKTELLTTLGRDDRGEALAARCGEIGIGLSNALWIPDLPTSVYLYMTDENGDMILAVSDMAICGRLTPAYLESRMEILNAAEVVIADANIPAESLLWLGEHCAAPLFCDPVSTTKAEKLRPLLRRINTLKPNRAEAALLAGREIRDPAEAGDAARILLDLGVKRVFISMDSDGVVAAENGQCLCLPCIPGRMVNTTGCGDAFMAALAWSRMEGMDLEESALAGLAAASLTMESVYTNAPGMSTEAIRERMAMSRTV